MSIEIVYYLAELRDQIEEVIDKISKVRDQQEAGDFPEHDEEAIVSLVWTSTRAIATFEMMMLSLGPQINYDLPDDWRQTIANPSEMSEGHSLESFIDGSLDRLSDLSQLYSAAFEKLRVSAELDDESFLSESDIQAALSRWREEL